MLEAKGRNQFLEFVHLTVVAAEINDQAAYVAGWLKKLRDDRKLLIHAAAQAQHAVDYILNRKPCQQ